MIEFRAKYVYAITHNVTGRTYVGSSAHLEDRLKSHLSALRRHGHPIEEMQKDFDKYGEHYSFRVLDMIPSGEFNNRERMWMFRLQTHRIETGYNYKDWSIRQQLDRLGQPYVKLNGISE